MSYVFNINEIINDIDEAKEKQVCSMCGGDATEFKDEISLKEYHLSGFCQSCQDKFFGEE